MATWKKVVISGSNISQLNNDAGYVTLATSPRAFATASISGTNLLADSPSGSLNFASSSGQGLTISGNAGTDTLTFGLSAIPNTSLANSTISGKALGTNLDNLTQGAGIASFTYNGSSSTTVAVSGASALSTNSVTKWTGAAFANSTITDNGILVTMTSPLTVTGSIIATTGFTGSLQGTASWASQALTASFLPVGTYAITASWAQSASNAINAQTASFLPVGTYAITASWAQSASNAINAQTASFLPVGTYAITASWAQSASNAINAQTASFLPVGTYAITASWAQSASNAVSAQTASNIFPSILNNTDNRVLTATGGGTINGESNLTFDGTTLTVTGNATITNNLIVQGTASFQQTTNLEVADRFVLFASGSNATGDGGIVVQQATQNVGELFGWDSGVSRWAVTSSFAANQSAFTPDAFMAAVVTAAGTTPSPATRYNAVGNIYVSSGDESIWIYS
jgi:hypothetical protein